jgi:hypothetical protein
MGIMTRKAGAVFSGFFGVGFVALSLITLLPATASKPNFLGYYGVCSWAPCSTVILGIIATSSLLFTLRLWKR